MPQSGLSKGGYVDFVLEIRLDHGHGGGGPKTQTNFVDVLYGWPLHVLRHLSSPLSGLNLSPVSLSEIV